LNNETILLAFYHARQAVHRGYTHHALEKSSTSPWRKSRPLVQSKTPANEIDIADGLPTTPARGFPIAAAWHGQTWT